MGCGNYCLALEIKTERQGMAGQGGLCSCTTLHSRQQENNKERTKTGDACFFSEIWWHIHNGIIRVMGMRSRS